MSCGYSPGIRSASPRRMAPRPRAQVDERLQAEADLQQRGQRRARGRAAEGDDERDDEAAHVGVDLVGRAGDADDEAAVLAEIDVALDEAQRALVRALAVAAADLAEARGLVGRRRGSAGRRRTAISTSACPAARASGRPTCQYQPESGSSKRGSPSGPSSRAPGRRARRGRRRGRWRRRGGAGRRPARSPRGRAPTGSAPR